jgi:hypothetical protein
MTITQSIFFVSKKIVATAAVIASTIPSLFLTGVGIILFGSFDGSPENLLFNIISISIYASLYICSIRFFVIEAYIEMFLHK